MRLCLLLAAVAAVLAAPAATSPVPRGPVSAAPRNPLDLLDDQTRSLAPDMADPLPPARHRARTVTAAARPHGRPAVQAGAVDPYRLPTILRPTVYHVTVEPDFSSFTISGNVLIVVNVLADTDEIVLHAKEITVDEESIQIGDARSEYMLTTAVKVTYEKQYDFLRIKLANTVPKNGRMRIYMEYTGILNNDLDGFYRSSYKTSTGETRWLATTQFEETGARRAFPCWDEPSFKARFYILVTHDKTRGAISNMPVINSAPNNDGSITEQYDGSLPMSTYLVAFIVSDFASVTNAQGNFTTWTRKDLIKGAQYSQEIGQKALKLLTDYTGIVYALPKEDQVAIPDFAAGAMENWGLVTYREEYLIEQDTQNIRIAEFMMTTICHELGHQWTGDLVTLDWWAHTWLNEGFADYFENFICSEINPQWNLRDKGVVADHQRGMEYDAVETMHAMSSPVSTPAEDSSKFDRISYSKGGAVIRMWENMLGLDVLKKGLHRYLSINIFKNTNPEQLFKAIDLEAQKARVLPSGLSFPEIARTWTEQPGVPVVTATRDYDKGAVVLSQERFFYAPPSRPALLKQRWHVPVTVVAQGSADWTNTKPTTWLSPAEEKTSVTVKASSAQWVLVNPKAIGYFRVNYDEANWKLLASALASNPSAIPAASRTQLINDALALARGKQLSYAVALDLFSYLKGEQEVAPWMTGVTSLSWLRSKLGGTDAFPHFLTFMKKLTDPTYTKVGYTGSSDHETRYLRYYVVSYACYAGNADCIAQAGKQLKTWLADSTTKLDADTQAVTMCYGLRGADSASNFNALKAKWIAEKDADARAALVAALACAPSASLTSLLTDAINSKLTGVSQSDVVDLWQAILNRPEQVDTLFKFAETNVATIDAYFSGSDANSGAIKLLVNCIGAITSTEKLNEARWWVEDNFKGNANAAAYSRLQEAFLDAYVSLDWYRTSYKAVADWLKTA